MSKIKFSIDVSRRGPWGIFVASKGDEVEIGDGDGQVSPEFADRVVSLKLAKRLADEPTEKPKGKKALRKEADLAATALVEAGEGAQAAKDLLDEVELSAQIREGDPTDAEKDALLLAKASVEESDEAVAAAKRAHEAAEAALASR